MQRSEVVRVLPLCSFIFIYALATIPGLPRVLSPNFPGFPVN